MIYIKSNSIVTYRLFISAFLFLFLLFSNIYSQEPIQLVKLQEVINFDGVPDEEVWSQIAPIEMIMHMPVFGNEPSEASSIKIAYDDKYLYVSGVLSYKDPSTIKAVSKKRDYASTSTDWFGIILDTYNDKENAVGFFTNPNGIRTDGTSRNDASEVTDVSFTWNTFWDVISRIDDNGWTTEFRIPFSSLRFQVEDGKTLMGITVMRFIATKSEMVTFPAISPDYLMGFWKPSLYSTISFEGLKPENPIYITPYITSGLSQVNELNEANTAYDMDSRPKFDAGLDGKYSLTNNLTMDLTVNTDFAQVEADDQKINLSRFSLFFPEKRVFFQEKADVFDFSFLGGNNLFYSRRIGIYDGNPVRLFGGLRLTGKINEWDIGVLDMQSAAFEENPGENFGVFRVKRAVINQNSCIGGMLTSRLGMNGAYNLAYGVDGQFRVIGDEYLTIKLAQTFENGAENMALDLSPSRILLRWDRRKQIGFGYDFFYTYSGDSFNPGIGFELKENYQGFRAILNYGWLAGDNSVFRYQKLSAMGVNLWNTATGLQETAMGLLSWEFEAKKGSAGSAIATWFQEDLADTLTLGNDQAFVPEGRYSFTNVSALLSTTGSKDLRFTFLTEAGSFYDGWKLSFSASPTIIIGTGINLGLTYNFDYVSFSSRSIDFTNHIVGLKGILTLTTKTSLSAFVQYNTAVKKYMANIRFRFNPREGNDFYIVYNEGLNTNLTREVPSFPRSADRTILLKYTYTFKL